MKDQSADRASMWNNRYSEPGYAYGTEPNQFFKTTLDSLGTGRILLPAEGEGRNAIYAAKLGWEVTAIDISDVARKKALDRAARENLIIEYKTIEIESFLCDKPQFDLIALIYLHMPPVLREKVHKQLISCLAPGGIFMMEAFHTDQINNNTGGPRVAELLYKTEDIRTEFHGLKINYLEHVREDIHEGPYHNGLSDVIRLIAERE